MTFSSKQTDIVEGGGAAPIPQNRKYFRLAWAFGVLLAASALLNAALVVRQGLAYREIEAVTASLAKDPEAMAVIEAAPRVRSLTRALVSDLAAYGQKQPGMIQVLLKHGVKVNLQPAPSNR